MEDWERAFSEKSERRRRRAKRDSLIKWIALLALLAATIGLGIWAADTLATEYITPG